MLSLDNYKTLIGEKPLNDLKALASVLKGVKIVHINSTKEGGGVAEILMKMIPIAESLGIDMKWEIIEGSSEFFHCSKTFHNLLQGQSGDLPSPDQLSIYEETNAKNARSLKDTLENADIVFIHDPQPLALISHFPKRKGKWIWRCHIDLSTPNSRLWEYLKPYIEKYDASVFSLEEFVRPLSHPVYVIAPSIDPLCEKNIDLSEDEIAKVFNHHQINRAKPTLLQVSRFDRFKDPIGVIEAYRMTKRNIPNLQLIFAGSEATDDPEGEEVLHEVKEHCNGDPDIFLLLLPPTAHRAINALQRGTSVVIQKSLKEGFGLTVTEALWKKKAVIGGKAGGIKLQIIDQKTGFLVESSEEAAKRIEELLSKPQLARSLGEKGKEHVIGNFLITRHLREYLSVMAKHLFPDNKISRLYSQLLKIY